MTALLKSDLGDPIRLQILKRYSRKVFIVHMYYKQETRFAFVYESTASKIAEGVFSGNA
jgi:hypothetical protein